MNKSTNIKRVITASILVAIMATATVLGVILIFNNNVDKTGDNRNAREPDVNQPASTINMYQWLQDNPHDIINYVDLGESNTLAYVRDDDTTKIYSNTSFSNINGTYTNITSAIMDFYLDLEGYPAGIYKYAFRIVFDNVDKTIQSYVLFDIFVTINNDGTFVVELLTSKNSLPIKMTSLFDRLSIQFDVKFAGANTYVNSTIHDATDNLASTTYNNQKVHYYVLGDSHDTSVEDSISPNPTSIRSIAFASGSSHWADSVDSGISDLVRQDPTIDLRALQLA